MNFAPVFLALLAVADPSSRSTAGPVLLDFHAEWCGPCRQMRKPIAALAREGMPIKSIDIDQAPDTASRYDVKAVPTFIVVDARGRELDRTSGMQPASELKRFFETAAAKAKPPANSNAHAATEDPEEEAEADRDDRRRGGDQEAERPVNPKPWETVVRIKIMGSHSIGFGSGTVIASTPEESLILTCAHIFKIDGRKPTDAEHFPRKIMVDLFDGKLRGTSPAQVHFVESVEGKAVDYDFGRDVGLIRIRPGRRLPFARVAPDFWSPQARMRLITVGCSEGHDATAWETAVVRPRMGFSSGSAYEAIECTHAPAQGRSGGGLFTEDGYVTGVCNFAEPTGDHGLYATPRSIYWLLDRNELTALYKAPRGGSETLVADRGGSRREDDRTIARMQTDDQDDRARKRGRAAAAKAIMIPPPTLLGVAEPVDEPEADEPERTTSKGVTSRTSWRRAQLGEAASRGARATDLDLDPEANNDKFAPEEDARPAAPSRSTSRKGWHAVPGSARGSS